MRLPNTHSVGTQVLKAILYLRMAPQFIKENKLWQGYLSIGWLFKLTIIIAIVFSYTFITEIYGLVSSAFDNLFSQESSSFSNKLKNFWDNLLFSGSMKYLIMILLETIIFHFAAKTREILSGEKNELKMEQFIAAEIRMIKVVLVSWVLELAISIVLQVALSLIGFDFMLNVLFFMVQCYFLGHAFIDNYNEQNGRTIKESFNISYDHIGAALVMGFVAYILFMIPLLGMIVTPFLCAVSTITYMYYWDKEANVREAKMS